MPMFRLAAGITAWVMFLVLLYSEATALPVVVRFGTLFAIGSPAAPFVLFVQTILASVRSDPISFRIRNAHWMVLAPFILIYAVILILGLFSGLHQP